MNEEIHLLVTRIYHVLEQSRNQHLEHFISLLEMKHELPLYIETINKYNHSFTELLVKYKSLLETNQFYVRNYQEEYEQLQNRNIKHIQQDMQRTKRLNTIQTKLQQCKSIQNEMVDVINTIYYNQSHINLCFDHILFDNIIMLDKILRNTELLSQICNKEFS